MIDNSKTVRAAAAPVWPRLCVLLLIVAVLGLPINDLLRYAILALAALLAFTSPVRLAPRLWLAAVVLGVLATVLRIALAPSPIQEGHNLFLPDETPGVLSASLPPPVYRFMAAKFDTQYPADKRCRAGESGCWRGQQVDRTFAFSADSALTGARDSRTVTTMKFDNPIWQRLGFANDERFNWLNNSDVQRVTRNRQFWKGYDRWQFAMPWFVRYQFPTDYAGSNVCWRGDVLWENAGGGYDAINHVAKSCRELTAADVGKSIYGVAVVPGSLAMELKPSAAVLPKLVAQKLVPAIAALLIIVMLIRIDWRTALPPGLLIVLALLTITLNDISPIGGLRPFDGGDDGLVYTGWARAILQDFLRGDFAAALRGQESVYYYGGPGLRYLRALEMVIFGDSNLGYLSVLLLLPLAVWRLLKLFVPATLAWTLALGFTLLPLGEIFGTSFIHFARWTARGFADPMAQILLVCGIVVILGALTRNAIGRAQPFGWGALLLALAVFVKPMLAPMVGVFMAGTWLFAVLQRRWLSAAMLCVGFTPVLLMPLHNWVFGRRFVLFSSNTGEPETYTMPVAAYGRALAELLRLDFTGANIRQGLTQIALWLSGPGGLAFTIPLHAAAVAVLIYVVFARRFTFALRLLAATALAQQPVALFYLPSPRYFYVMWLLTGVVVAAVLVQVVPAARWRYLASWLPSRIRRFDVARITPSRV